MDYSESKDIISDDFDDVTHTGCGSTLPCDPRRRLHRYLILFFICFLSFGSYFVYDNPAALEDIIMMDLKVTTLEYMNLYAFYNWPNVVLSCIGGFLIDRVLGMRLGAIIFGGFVLLGQLVFAGGAYFNMLWLCYLGRFTFGIGGENLAVTQNAYASSWFLDTELNFIFGLQLSISRVGSTVNMNSMEKLYNALSGFTQPYQQLGVALFIAASTCVFSVLCAVILAMFDWRRERVLKTASHNQEEVPVIKFTDIRYFSIAFWLICGICVGYYVTVFPFVSLSKVFFMQKFEESGENANRITSLVYIVSAAASPVSGFCIDFTGKNLFWVGAGTLATFVCHGLFAFTFLSPYAVIILFGISYSVLASSLWPLVAIVIPSHQRGTAFGIMQSIQNLGLGVIGLLAGVIQDRSGFLILEIFFCLCLCLTLILLVFLYIWDRNHGSKLNESGKSRRKRVAEKEFTVSQAVST